MNAFIGIFSSGLASICTYPIDVIKTNFQVTRITNPESIHSVIKNTYARRGIMGFYSGIGPQLSTYPLFWGIFFQINSYKLTISQNKNVNKFINANISSAIASTLINPLFVIKTRLQTYKITPKYNHLIKKIYQNEGMSGFYKGLIPTILNNTKLGIQFPLYDLLMEKSNNVIYSATISKFISTSIFYPLDLIRINQRNSSEKLCMMTVAKMIYKHERFFGFYRGIGLYTLISTPNFVLMLYFKEYLTNILS